MPIYEYQCDNCEHRLESIHKVSDTPLKQCPECNEETLRKLMSAAAFKLTGSGWYETDFKDNKPENKDPDKAPNNKEKDKAKKPETKEATGKGSDDTSKSSESTEAKTDSNTNKQTLTKNQD